MFLKRLFILSSILMGVQTAHAIDCTGRYFYLVHPAKLHLNGGEARSVASESTQLWEPTVTRKWQLIHPLKLNFSYHSSLFYRSEEERKSSEAEIENLSDNSTIFNCFE